MSTKSCMTCPSALTPQEASNFFGKSTGVSMCARYGRPLARTNSGDTERVAIAETLASACDDHGKPKPIKPNWENANFLVAFPDVFSLNLTQHNEELVNNCRSCTFFAPPSLVLEQWGWAAGLCTVKGKLILDNRTTHAAKGCEKRSLATAGLVDNLSGITLMPEYEESFTGRREDPTKAAMKTIANFVEPSAYETDAPVTDEETERGIRAWRKIVDKLTGNSIMLPIFNPEHFSPAERELIPKTGDDEHPEDYVDHNFYVYKVGVLWSELDETPAFWGKAGTGKTEFYRHMAYLMQLPFYRFSITGSTELDDLAGKMHYTEGVGTHFAKGRMVNAWESPCVMVVDEPNAGPPDVWQFLRPMTDNSKQLVLDQSGGERSIRNNDCYLGMAMNPSWDILNVGTQPIGDADANRLMHLYIELPSETLEKEILTKRCAHDGWEVPADVLSMVMSIAKDIRSLSDEGTLPISWAIRPQIKVIRALRWFDAITAYKMASADFLEPAQQQVLLDVVRSHDTVGGNF